MVGLSAVLALNSAVNKIMVAGDFEGADALGILCA
jgi:hypothetical protein